MIKDLTEGNPWKQILLLSLPLLIGNVLQASYNLADTVIVGKFAGTEALAGVGIASTVFNLLNALLIGFSQGSSIVISQLFGAGRKEELPRAVSTILWTSLGMAVLMVGVGQACLTPLLRLLGTPDADMPYAVTYLRYIVFGLVCSIFYNQFTGMLRGLGNTVVPLYVLVFSCVVNIGLNLLLTCVFSMGVAGVALATMISEGLSAVITGAYIVLRVPLLRPGKGVRRDMFSAAVRFGSPLALMQASISLGHLLLVTIVNSFGTAVIAAYTAGTKVDMFAVMPIVAISTAVSTFVAQNMGAGKADRVDRGARAGFVLSEIVSIAVGLVIFFCRGIFMGFFVSEQLSPQYAAEVTRQGCIMLTATSLGYWILSPIHIINNVISGAGKPAFSMWVMVSMMALRLLLCLFFIHVCSLGALSIWLAFPTPWIVTSLFDILVFRSGKWKKNLRTV